MNEQTGSSEKQRTEYELQRDKASEATITHDELTLKRYRTTKETISKSAPRYSRMLGIIINKTKKSFEPDQDAAAVDYLIPKPVRSKFFGPVTC